MRLSRTLATTATAVLLGTLAWASPASAVEIIFCPGETSAAPANEDAADRNGDGFVCTTPGGQSVDNNASTPRRRR